jgi:hypothetical protein
MSWVCAETRGQRSMMTRWRPFYPTAENWRYRLYIERKYPPMVLWGLFSGSLGHRLL